MKELYIVRKYDGGGGGAMCIARLTVQLRWLISLWSSLNVLPMLATRRFARLKIWILV